METVLEKLKRSKKGYLTSREVAALGIRNLAELRMDRWRRKGIPFERINRRVVRYDRVELIRFLEKNHVDTK